MKKLILITSVMLLTQFANAIGNEGGGGGEPYAQQFIDFGYKLGEFFNSNPFSLEIPFSSDDFIDKIKLIDESIKDETVRDLLEFTDDKLKDKDGIEKPAIFDINTNSIRANRSIWRNYTTTEKLIQITMEITGLLKTPLRYENAAALVESRSALISSIVINKKTEYQIPGWHVVGGDADQFSRITKNDVIIDAGTLGDGNANHPAIAFFKKPLDNTDWINKILAGWRNGSGAAYFLVAAPHHERVALAAIQITQEAEAARQGNTDMQAAVYLVEFVQTHSVFTGPCANPEKLSAFDRIKTCYLNLQLYIPNDDLVTETLDKNAGSKKTLATIQNLIISLGSMVQNHFALNQKSLQSILREHYITDYSSTLISVRGSPLKKSANAHGLKASLAGSFGETPFWIKTNEFDKDDLKFYRALQILAENGLAYADENVRCAGIKAPTLVQRKKYLALEREKKCFFTSMGVTSPLYKVMEKSGFTYNEEKSKWQTSGAKP